MSAWYVINNSQHSGPHSDETIIGWIRAGQLSEAKIARPNGAQWLNLADHPPFAEHLRAMGGPSTLGHGPPTRRQWPSTYVPRPYSAGPPHGRVAGGQPKGRKTGLIVTLALLGTCGVCTIAAKSGSEPRTQAEAVEPSTAPPAPAEATVEPAAQVPIFADADPSPAARARPDLPPLDKGVVMELKIRDTDARLPLVTGITNLPDGTALMVSVESRRGFNGSANAKVVDGRFSAGPFGPAGGLPDGMYTAEIMTPFVGVQPDEVQAILGRRGKNLKGKLVHKEDGEKSVEVRADFHIGRDAESAAKADQAALANTKQAAKAAYEEAMALVALGTDSFDPLRERSDLAAAKRCGELMHGAGGSIERAKAVRALADGLPSNPYFDLKVATVNLQSCVTCSGWGAEHCEMAKSNLREAKKTIR